VQRELLARGASRVLITNCGCLGPCFDGPNAVVYPDGVWYAGLVPGDAAGLADHLASGHVLAAKLSHRPGLEAEAEPADDEPCAETAAESASGARGSGSAAVRDRDHSDGKPGRR
jgi:(2Fe-2S) ferredoxin